MERLQYHFEPRSGWMNDPNGLVFFRGQYHAFFQHNPHDIVWGPMHWGHAVSRDLLHWEELPIALTPDQPYENGGGCFSGSAVVKDDRLYLFYTSVSETAQTQSVAYSDDGVHFQKYEGNPVIGACPEGHANFRDPKVSEIDGTYYMVVGAGNSRIGRVLLFASEDLLRWEYRGILFEDRRFAPCMECPDFFRLGDSYVLMFSRMGTRAHRAAQLFVIGDFHGGKLIPEQIMQPERGEDFYAGQTFLDADGRRILIGWMWHWGKEAEPGARSAGALSIPRELSLEGGVLRTFPCRQSRPLLKKESAYVRREGRMIVLTDGVRVRKKYPVRTVGCLDVLEDTGSVEVFLDGGRESWTYYKADGNDTDG